MSETMEDFIRRSDAKHDAERREPTDGAPQKSAQWLFDRCGFVTCSRFKDVMDKLKSGKPGAKREAYLWETVVERVTGQPQNHYFAAPLQWGNDQEPHSRMHNEVLVPGRLIEEVGFVKHPTIKWVGGSADGIIGDDGIFESKSPWNSANHLKTILAGEMPEEHMPQVQGLLWVLNRQWCEFQSFDPRLPEPLNCFRQRIERDDAYISAMAAEVIVFAGEVEELVARLADYKEAVQ